MEKDLSQLHSFITSVLLAVPFRMLLCPLQISCDFPNRCWRPCQKGTGSGGGRKFSHAELIHFRSYRRGKDESAHPFNIKPSLSLLYLVVK
jgi:hypothetical protein